MDTLGEARRPTRELCSKKGSRGHNIHQGHLLRGVSASLRSSGVVLLYGGGQEVTELSYLTCDVWGWYSLPIPIK